MSGPALRLAVLRRLAERLVEVVLDVDLREPDEDGCVPPASEGGAVRSACFVSWLAWKRLRRRESGALVAVLGLAVATAVLAGVLAGVTIATDRSTALAIERIPASRTFGARCLVRRSRRSERTPRRARPCGRRRVRRVRARRADAAHPVPREHGGGAVRRDHGDRRCLRARDPALGSAAAHVHGRSLRGAPAARARSVAERPGPADSSRSAPRTLRSRQLFGDFLLLSDAATADATVPPELGETSEYHRPPPPPLVVAEGRGALAASPALARTYRTYAWVWPLGAGQRRGSGRSTSSSGARSVLASSSRALVLVRRRRARRGAAGGRARGERRRDASAARRRRGRRAAPRVHDPRGTRHAARPRGGPAATHVVRRAALAARGCSAASSGARSRSSVSLVGWIAGIAVGGIVAGLAGAPAATCCARASSRRPGWGSRSRPLLAAALVVDHRVAAAARGRADRSARPRRGVLRCSSSQSRSLGGALTRSGSRAARERRSCCSAPRPRRDRRGGRRRARLPGARALRGRPRRRRSPARLAAVGLGARAGRRGRHGRVPDDRVRRRAARGGLSRDARARRARAGGLPGAARRRRPRGPPEPRARLRRGAARAVRRARRRGRRRAARCCASAAGAGRAERVSGVTVLGLDQAAIEDVGVWRDDWASGRGRAELAALVEPGRGGGHARRAAARTAESRSRSARASCRSLRSCARGRVVSTGRARRGAARALRRCSRARAAPGRAPDAPRDRSAAAAHRGRRRRGGRLLRDGRLSGPLAVAAS